MAMYYSNEITKASGGYVTTAVMAPYKYFKIDPKNRFAKSQFSVIHKNYALHGIAFSGSAH